VSIDQPIILATERIKHSAAVDLTFTRWMLSDVSDPELIGMRSMKLSINQITGRDYTAQTFDFPNRWQASDPIHAHQHRHQGLN
jgi:hypothetical protein